MAPNGSPAEVARTIIDESLYLVLATADHAGRPWSSPVYFAHVGWREFYWASSPQAAHSRNIAVRPQVGIAVFDSSAPIGTGQGVYMSAVAERVDERELAHAIDVFSSRSVTHGGRALAATDVGGTSGLDLYHAAADDHWILAKDGQPDHRMPVHVA